MGSGGGLAYHNWSEFVSMYTAIERGGKKVTRTYFTTGAIMILRKILKWMIAGESIVISMLLLWIL
jgi:hypothetical protein